MYFRKALLLFVVTFCLLAAGDYILQNKQTHNSSVIERTSSNRYQAGFKVYKKHCQNCHGKKGDGKGTFSGLNGTPIQTDFTDRDFIRTRDELTKVVRDGGPAAGLDPLMLAWGTTLSKSEINDVVFLIQRISKEGTIRKPLLTEEK